MPVRLVSQEELPGPLAGYRLIERLGRGGFGEVWKVEAPGGLLKAIKFVFGDLDGDATRTAARPSRNSRRSSASRTIRHPYILSLERFDIIDGQLIIVMELADRNLWDRFRECRTQGLPGIPRDELLRYMEEAAEALDLMNNALPAPAPRHQAAEPVPGPQPRQGRRLRAGEGPRRRRGRPSPAASRRSTPPRRRSRAGCRRFSDQYSLAIVYQELLTGTRPFNGANTRQLLMQHINGTPDLTSAAGPPTSRSSPARLARSRTTAGRVARSWSSGFDRLAAPPRRRLGGQAVHRSTSRSRRGTASRRSSRSRDSPLSRMRRNPVSRLDGAGRRAAGSSRHPPESAGSHPDTVANGLPPLVSPSGSRPGTQSAGSAAALGRSGSSRRPPPARATRPSRCSRPDVFQTGRMGSLGIAPPEKTGDGALFPALVVAVGQTGPAGARAPQARHSRPLRQPDRVPNVRFLYIDTDPEPRPPAPCRTTRRAWPRARSSSPG